MAQSTFSRSVHGTTEPFELQVSRGQIQYHSQVTIFGYQPNVATTSIPAWENASTYTPPASASTMNVASSNPADTAVTIQVNGLDSNYNAISETLTLNGTSNVVTSNSYLRLNSMVTVAGNAAGNVTIKSGTTTYLQMNAGIGKSQNSWYTVPAGNTLWLSRAELSTNLSYAGTTFVTYQVQTTTSNGVVLTVLQQPFVGNFIALRSRPFPYTEKTDVQFQVKASANANTAVGVIIEGTLIQNDVSPLT
jgi:hypothetical protein